MKVTSLLLLPHVMNLQKLIHPICSIAVAKLLRESARPVVSPCVRAVIVEAPGGAAADHLKFKAKDRRPGNGYKEPALPIEVLV